MTEPRGAGAAPAARPGAVMLLGAIAIAATAGAVLLTWRRIFFGMDLQDESYYVLVPWRWCLGDRPFVQEENLAQVAGLVEYPFVKLFAVIRDYDVTGLVLYTRHLYLLLMLLVAAVVWLAVRRIVRWELALPIAAVYVTFIFWQTPQLSYNTMGAAFFTLGIALVLRVVLGGRVYPWAFAGGVSFGLAAVAYPTLVFTLPFCAACLAFSLGRRSVVTVADLALAAPPDPEGPSTGRLAWRAVSAVVLGVLVVVVPVGLVVLSFGVGNLRRCWTYSHHVAQQGGQLGGAAKAAQVVQGFTRLLWSRPYLLLAAAIVYLVYRRWPRLGRGLLALLPAALWLAGQRSMLNASGFAIIYVFLAPYLYLFIPRGRRETGVKLLFWVWVPALLAGAMTAFTSAAGYVNAAVGLAAGMMASGVFLAWCLEAVWAGEDAETRPADDIPAIEGAGGVATRGVAPPRGGSWLALLVLTAVLAVTILFQFQFQQRDVPYSSLTQRCDFGPWRGITLTPQRYAELKAFSADLRAETRPGDQVLIFYQACGYYLFWNGGIAANSYWLSNADPLAPLPQSTFDYYRRNRVVPTLAVHLVSTVGMSDEELTATCGGLSYPPVLVRPRYAFQRKPSDETTRDVIARLP